ncbi:metallophosphoesterase [Sunxiuqinia dokdonensis]|uniref:DNA mismatch repair protein MutT n=1 Tax=Sunxiuqinia dokdonensis TaxID=1409788 RepID=A0A0L8V2B3_9BACT|nr:metallophosphoesterase [Sunxiuqinia dokdonensis]KOH42561.1 DNA mismatch repair protein MutT [Sunxiuqinia dokdonensis]
MISKPLLFFGLFILAVEYYSFVALRTVLKSTNSNFQWGLFILYAVLSLAILWSFWALPNYGKSAWPSLALKYTVNILIGVFLGKTLVAAIMLIGDLLLVIPNTVKFLTQFRSSPADGVPGGARFISRFTFISQTALLLGAVLTSGLVYGMTNRYRYQIRRVRLPIPSLPDAFKGLRIVQISDIHSGSFDDPDAVAEGVASILDQKPDLILFTGDIVNDKAEELAPYLQVFKKLNAPLGVYSVLGNHDYGDYVSWSSDEAKKQNLEQLKQHHAAMGWRLLMNENVVLEHRGQDLALIGIENWGAKAGFPKYGDLQKATAGLENGDVPLKILLSHDPSHWEAEVRKSYPDIALTLSGHTHGMQFGIDIPGFKWSPVQYVYDQWAGLYQQENQFLYVNRGFGFIGYQGRLGILPEITVIELA